MSWKADNAACQRGFTLIELMIVVVILGILIAISMPLYQGYVEQSRRTEARTVLLETAQQLERCYSTYGAYDDSNCGLINAAGNLANDIESENGWYVISAANSTINETAFTLQAEAQRTQTNDDCDDFTIDQTGSRGVGEGTVDECW
ncbi:MAG: type IV pilin protein [Halofilum sp. (in: g-proteobacteria)]|nr:type IV pilin protein [Halofilum sp. (in: g-proteobacteria)]